MNKNKAFSGLAIAGLTTLFFILTWQGLTFNYDFENFFQENDPDLDFYREYREKFENDNDYLLIALGHKPDIYDSLFLEQSLQLKKEISGLEGVLEVVSLLDQEEALIGPFGVNFRPLLDWSSSENLKKTAQRLSEDDLWKGSLMDENARYLLLLVKNKQRIAKEEGDRLYMAIEGLLRQSEITDYKAAGKIKAQGAFVSLLQEEFAFFFVLAIICVLLLLWLLYRVWWAIVLPLIIILIGIFWTIAFLLLTGGELDIMLVMQPPILMVIGLSGMVHILSHYQGLIRKNVPKEKAVALVFGELALPIFLTALTTALGFISLYFTDVYSLKWFGLYTGLGVLFMFTSLMSLLPVALFTFAPLGSSQNKVWEARWENSMGKLYQWILAKKSLIAVLFVSISLLAGIFMSQVKTDGYILDNLPEDHPLMADFRFFDERFSGSKPLEIFVSVENDDLTIFDYQVLSEMDKLAAFIKENYKTENVLSPLTLIKSINKARNGGNPKAFRLPSELAYQGMDRIRDQFMERRDLGVWSEDLKSGRMSARMEDLGSFEGQRLHQNLNRFVENNVDKELLQVRITGTSFLIDKSHEQVTQNVFEGLGFAFFLVVFIVGLLYKSWRIAFLVLLPNIVPLLWIGGAMYWFGIDFKLSTSIVFAIAFGIAVDDSIHFMTNLRLQMAKGNLLDHAMRLTFMTTGKAIVLTTFILSSGFLVLMFSDLEIPWFAGFLVSLSLFFALLADLFWLPVLLLSIKKLLNAKVIGALPEKQKLQK
ncbi:efflux RND transporter permease subunit [Cyclobacterium plantarum]|uniref:efflux RND transporter permease subunit n=1 Tax=Cyclobacterium plantarum TaxID=2716263 RepID=UPI003F718688